MHPALHIEFIVCTVQTTGGPAVMVWGWVVVSFFTLMVGAAMGGASLSFLCHIHCIINSILFCGFWSVIPAQRSAAPIPRAADPTSGRQCLRNPSTLPSRAGSQAGLIFLARSQSPLGSGALPLPFMLVAVISENFSIDCDVASRAQTSSRPLQRSTRTTSHLRGRRSGSMRPF